MDVYTLGAVFEKILAHVDGDLRASNFARDSQTRRPEFRQTMLPASKTLTRDDFYSLFRAMMENDETRSLSVKEVADYLRLGNFEWSYWFGRGEIFCKTCGDCCI
jgi:hypothetical protein